MDGQAVKRYDWEKVPREELTPLITRQVIHTPSATILRVTFGKGAVLPIHDHIHEQVTMLTTGRLRVDVAGEETVLGPGEVILIPSSVPHRVEALEDSVGTDIFTPARTDWQ